MVGDMCDRGVSMVGGMHGRGCVWQGVYMAGGAWQGGMCGRGHAWQILRDTVNEQAVTILLECTLV